MTLRKVVWGRKYLSSEAMPGHFLKSASPIVSWDVLRPNRQAFRSHCFVVSIICIILFTFLQIKSSICYTTFVHNIYIGHQTGKEITKEEDFNQFDNLLDTAINVWILDHKSLFILLKNLICFQWINWICNLLFYF